MRRDVRFGSLADIDDHLAMSALPPKADAGPQADATLSSTGSRQAIITSQGAPFGNHVARFSDCASCGKTRKAQQPFAAFQSVGAGSTRRTSWLALPPHYCAI